MICVNAFTIILYLSSKQTHRHTQDAVKLIRNIQAHTSSLGACRVRGVTASLDALTALINILWLLILKFMSLAKSRRADISKIHKVVRSLALVISAFKFGSNLFESNLCWIQMRVRVLVEFGVYLTPTRSNGL